MTSAFSWQNSISLCRDSFCTPRPNLPVTPGVSWLPTLLFASLLFTAICKASSDSHFAFLHFFFLGWSWSLSPVQVMNLLVSWLFWLLRAVFIQLKPITVFSKKSYQLQETEEGNTEIHKYPKLSPVYLQNPLGQILTVYKHYLQCFPSCHGQLLKALILIRVYIMPRR